MNSENDSPFADWIGRTVTVWLKNGDVLSGEVVDVPESRYMLNVQLSGAIVTIPLRDVAKLQFT